MKKKNALVKENEEICGRQLENQSLTVLSATRRL